MREILLINLVEDEFNNLFLSLESRREIRYSDLCDILVFV